MKRQEETIEHLSPVERKCFIKAYAISAGLVIQILLDILLVILLIGSVTGCSATRKLNTIKQSQMSAELVLPQMQSPQEIKLDEPQRDTLVVSDFEGREVIIMKAIKDENGEMVASDVLDAAYVTARFRNVAERLGKVNLEFQIRVPEMMQDSDWQLRFYPRMAILGDTVKLSPVYITGANYRKAQLRGYEQYQRFLDRIISDSTKFINVNLLEIFIKRNIPQLYAFKTDSTYVSDETFASIYGVTEQEAIDHYTDKLSKDANERRKSRRQTMFRKYVKAPIETEVCLDTVIVADNGDFIYNYVQTINTRPKLRKVDILLGGEIYQQSTLLYTIPETEPLTFYIKSFAVFERYKGYKTMTIGGVSPLVFEEYIDYRINVKMNTNMELVDKALVPLYQAVDYARRLGYVDDVVAAKILENRLKFREVEYAQAMELEGPVKYLTEDRIEALEKYYSSCRNTTLREAVQLFLFSYYACGLRLSDVMTLQWDHINPESRTFRKVQVKTKKLLPMEMPLCRKALAILKEWKGRNPVFVFDLLSSTFDLRNSEAIYDARNSLDKHMNSALEKVSRELGFERPITFHQARHSFAVMAINKGMRVEVISKLLGHSSIISTEKTYARFLRSTIDDEIKKVME